jgi:lysophospholipase L1-like esterase
MIPPPFIAQPNVDVVVPNPPLQIAEEIQELTRHSFGATSQSSVGSPTLRPAIARPETSIQHPEFSQPDRSIPRYVATPHQGSQFYAQRLAALRVGKLYTRLPPDSFSEVWQQASGQPTYEQWRALLAAEAKAVTRRQTTRNLSILLGDSLSMWFPSDRLPQDQLWLNQGISGDTTRNILRRLSAFAKSRPNTIYLMAGVNDLKLGATDTEIVSNLQKIVHRLRASHPQAQLIVQSILPTRSPKIQNSRIAGINQRVAAIARQEGATYLDLYSQFADRDGQIVPAYTVDGIHLSAAGYSTWRSAVQKTELRLAQGSKLQG